MSDTWLKTLYAKRSGLFYLVCEFNLLPTRYIHADWIHEVSPGVSRELFTRLLASPRSERRLAGLILAKRNIDTRPFHDFRDVSHRLALLDAQSLEKLLFYTGIAITAGSISQQVQRAKVLAVREALGEAGYRFALKKAPFLLGTMEYPASEIDNVDDISSLLFQRGVQCLKCCLAEAPPSLVQRMLLKLPRELSGYWDLQSGISTQDRRQAFLVFKRILLQEVSSEWAPYFS